MYASNLCVGLTCANHRGFTGVRDHRRVSRWAASLHPERSPAAGRCEKRCKRVPGCHTKCTATRVPFSPQPVALMCCFAAQVPTGVDFSGGASLPAREAATTVGVSAAKGVSDTDTLAVLCCVGRYSDALVILVADCAFVLVAGGLGTRLGFHGIKVSLPTESSTGLCLLGLYVRPAGLPTTSSDAARVVLTLVFVCGAATCVRSSRCKSCQPGTVPAPSHWPS